MKKRAIYSIAVATLCVSVLLGIFFYKPKLSKMSDNKCEKFLVESGVDIPDGFSMTIVKEFLTELEEDPKTHVGVAYGQTSFYKVGGQLRVVANMYYHTPKLPRGTILSQMDENECKQFLTDAGVRMFDNYNMTAVQNLLAEIEKNPDMKAPSQDESLTLPDFLYDQLRVVVNMYYK